jgi:nucleotide-binding universal stress UspA family protein
MYKTILLTLDSTPTDRVIIEHIKKLAKFMQAKVILLHVADGWAARTFGPDAVSPEVTEDTLYLNQVLSEFQSSSIPAEAQLAFGEPSKEIVKWVEQKGCDLVAMSTHGHGPVEDLILGSVADHLRHQIDIPILMIRAANK